MPVMDDEPERERPEGAEEVGLWCNRCMLPSACRWPVEVGSMGSGRKISNLSVVVCVDCGARLDANGNVTG
jgi:hypothetical protein